MIIKLLEKDLTNAFSKKIENLEHAVALHFMYYNFCRIHQSLTPKRSVGVTPAMAAGASALARRAVLQDKKVCGS